MCVCGGWRNESKGGALGIRRGDKERKGSGVWKDGGEGGEERVLKRRQGGIENGRRERGGGEDGANKMARGWTGKDGEQGRS